MLGHRGPDYQNIIEFDYLTLGHTRLSILDLSPNANQPMFSADGNYIITYNGEIYNHQEIRKSLESRYSFKSTSDTETLLYGFIEYGKDILNKINGIYAFAILNKTTGDLFLARDPFGVKPLYYYHKDQAFIFSSEIKAIAANSTIDKKMNYSALENYISLLYSPGEDTPFHYVKKLKAGHWLEINIHHPGKLKTEKFYSVPFNGSYAKKSEEQWVSELEEQLIASVERQMLSDVPVGFFLSGGLDSGSLVALVRKLFPQRKIQCFTLGNTSGYEEEGFSDDLIFARKAAKHLNTELIEVNSDKDILRDFEEMIRHLDEPITDPAAFHTWNISRKAKEMGYKVLISGTGADEVFSGYRRHQALSLEKYFKTIPPFFIHALKKILSLSAGAKPNIRRLKKILSAYHPDQAERIISYFHWLPESETKKLFNKEAREKLMLYHSRDLFKKILSEIPHENSLLNKMLFLDMNTYSIDNNLLYTDRMSMANGVEIRIPYLDKKLVEFSTTIPPELKMKGLTTKYLLRQVMKKYLPEEILKRPKTGFGAPVRKWIISDMEPMISAYLSSEAIEARDIFDAAEVRRLIERNKKGEIDAAYSIWALMAVEVWMRKYADERKA